MSKKQNLELSAPVLKTSISFQGDSWGTRLFGLGISDSTIPKLQATLQRVILEMVDEPHFKVRVVTSANEKHFSVHVSDSKILKKIAQARTKAFKPKEKVIHKQGNKDFLSISWAYDINPLKPYPMLLFVPDLAKEAHHHIPLSGAQAVMLRDWLMKNLPSNKKPAR